MSSRVSLTLDSPRLLAILNITPDSFHDGGRLTDPIAALDRAEQAVDEGADALDIGGESTRPGAARVSSEEQARRVVPVIRAIRRSIGSASRVPISVDTTSSAVALAALEEGADAINDVSAGLDDLEMLPLAASRDAGMILMHRLVPSPLDRYSDQYDTPPEYTDVVREVCAFLRARADAAIAAGLRPDGIVLDPGLGFGKSVEQNIELLRRTPELCSVGFPVLSALSRKSFVGRVSLGRDSTPDERLAGTLQLSMEHFRAGARLFRVHDVPDHARVFARGGETQRHRETAC